MKAQDNLLNEVIRTLIQECGYERVFAALTRVSSQNQPETHPAVEPRRKNSRRGGSRKTPKLRASEQLARASLPDPHKAAIHDLALRFDHKQFLPSMADVREFLTMLGERPVPMKDRSDAFRQLLKALARLPTERIRAVASSGQYSGPSQLGPLSDAISAAGASLPRYREPSP